MSASVRSADSLDERDQDFLAQLRAATATAGPAAAILEDPKLMRALGRPRASSRRSAAAPQPSASPPRLLGRVLAAEHSQDTRLRALLRAAADRLEHEMRRADAAERRALYAEARARHAGDRAAGAVRAQHHAELAGARAGEEAVRYKMLFEGAQTELQHAQRDIDDLELHKARAESEARQARDVARQYERALAEQEARELGRQEGIKQMSHRFVEGIEAGRKEGYDFAKKQERAKRKKIYVEAFEAGRTEGYDEGNAEGRSVERRKALEAFDRFLEDEGYSEEASISGSRTPKAH